MDTLSFLKNYAHYIDLNANDTFAPAADCTTIDVHDLEKLMEVEELFGSYGVVAFQAHIRWEEPMEQYRTIRYSKAREYLRNWLCFEDTLKAKYEARNSTKHR